MDCALSSISAVWRRSSPWLKRFLPVPPFASSSEIMISCFKDNYSKSYFVGEKTYGKGTVQESHSLKSGNTIKYTVNKWYTSKGESIDGKGIVPDYNVILGDDFYDNPTNDNDAQINKAKEILKKNH